MSHKVLLLLALIGPILLIAAGTPMYGAAEESDSKRPARSQKIRSEATSAVPGETILPRLAL